MAGTAFDKISAGLNDAIAIAKGEVPAAEYCVHIPSEVNVRRIRRGLHMTQHVFAQRYGFSVARLRDWEQGRSRPDSAARAYLLVIERAHVAVDEALAITREENMDEAS